jgi:DNA gyrase subunit A
MEKINNESYFTEPVTIEQEMQKSYLDYSMSVIIGRAIPDIRDGLKPVHRRTLFSLQQTGTQYNKPYKKSARIVGDVIGKYHPHGDQAVYDTLVRLAQNFSLRYTLVDGQGNFGSIDGDPPAAMRYTEVRLNKISNELFSDLDKKTVNFIPNYDGSMVEPEIFPAALPMLMLNGSSGIAVGMATSIPPHNLCELIDAFVCYMDNKNISIDDLMDILKGPDFPTGGTIYGRAAIINAYKTGRGSVLIRAKADIEVDEHDRQKIIISEIPYQTNKSRILENIAQLVKDKKVLGISDLRDESDRDGMRIVIEIKKDEIAEVILNSLYKYTQLQATFSLNFLAIVNQQPKQFNLTDYFNYFLGHRKEIIRRRSLFELDKAEKRAHIIEGLKIALSHLDAIISTIRKANNRDEAKVQIMQKFPLSDVQTSAILDMQLYKLTNLEVEKLENEYKELMEYISYLKDLLSNEAMMLAVIKSEMIAIKDNYGDTRRTQLIEQDLKDIHIEDLIKDESCVILFTKNGYIKRMTLNSYKIQSRGTVGRKGLSLKEEDVITRVFVASAHDYILVFTEKGRMYWLKAYDIPEGDFGSRGKPVNRVVGISDEEKVCSVINVRNFPSDQFVMMFTRRGVVKKIGLSDISRPRQKGIHVADVLADDVLFEAHITYGNNDVIVGTHLGKAIRFNEQDVRVMGRGARGVIAIRMNEGDFLAGADIIREGDLYILTITERGYGKKSELSLYRRQTRGGKGILNIRINENMGKVIGLVTLNDNNDLIISSEKGVINKISSEEIRSKGRITQGVVIMNLKKNDKLVALEKMVKEENVDSDVSDDVDVE